SKTDFARKDPAQIKWAAAHLLSQHFQCRRVRQIPFEDLFHTLHSLASQTFLAHTEKFWILRREEKLRHELQCFGLVPKKLGCFRNRRLGEVRRHVALLHSHRTRRRDYVLFFVAKNNALDLRLKVGLILRELVSQMDARKF